MAKQFIQILHIPFQFSPDILFNNFLLPFFNLQVDTPLNFTMLVKSYTFVQARICFCCVLYFQFGFISSLLDYNTTTLVELPPFPLHPLNIWNWVSPNFCNKCCNSLCRKMQMRRLSFFLGVPMTAGHDLKHQVQGNRKQCVILERILTFHDFDTLRL